MSARASLRARASNFVKGNGRKSPQGFISDSRVVGYTSGTSADFTYDDFAKMSGGLEARL